MKTKLLFMFCFALIPYGIKAQGIKFIDNKTWKDVLAMAKVQKKLIFLDAYASWCGPCKYLQNNVFTTAEAGTEYNKNFINVKMDMEKGEGITLAKKYDVKAYPTLFFINQNGQLIHLSVGALEVDQFVALARDARNPQKQFYTVRNKAITGALPTSAFTEWLTAAKRIEYGGVDEVMTGYIKSNQHPLMEKDMLNIILDYANVLNDEQLTFLKTNRSHIIELTGRTPKVYDDIYTEKVVNSAVSKMPANGEFDFEKFNSLIAVYLSPEEANSTTKKLKTRYGLNNQTLSFEELITSDDEDVLTAGAEFYYRDKKEYLNKSKQLYVKLLKAGKKQKPSVYTFRIVQLNNALNNSDPDNYFGKVERLKQSISLVEKNMQDSTAADFYPKNKLSSLYGDLAWNQLFIKDFGSTIASAKKGIELAKENDWIYTNLALGYLLSGDVTNAKTLYIDLKNKNYANGQKSFKEAFLKDFEDLEQEGIIIPTDADQYRNVKEIKTLLNQ
ncbi:thioredoxin domain-containing protein [Mucilaginibacter endophyticus]|uniref:thioredoxin domain-containing protein n=1 Tax=Mucilaginibacter endophyticus TaxID=2675003 RepID=UPI000E0DB0AF|nr:thioredoxin domain-containing protein [Mucilaginibacter endophyticus]